MGGEVEAEEIGMTEAEMGVVERQKLECPGMEAVGTGSEMGNGRTSFTSLFALKVRDSLFLTNSSFSNVTKYNFNVPHVIRMVSIKYFLRQNEIKKGYIWQKKKKKKKKRKICKKKKKKKKKK